MDTVSNREDLVRRIATGERVKFLFFWGHTPSGDGSVTKTCFSQWFESPFGVDGITYATAEHWMMAEKARLFGDIAAVDKIVAASHPKQAKELGRGVANFDDNVWKRERFDIVVRGNLAKFRAHSTMREFLLGTGDRVLVEASPRDTIWGIGLGADNPCAEKPAKWRGLNLLGFALMEVRRQLREEV
ncbi:NADAR family protein [Haloferula sp. BvORR071]|uniref:NADAR family protein n=1 Tax=Haloferula sp. BvORR071 TaxID=1396141 RepID=UPI000558A41F|nr:NADAR family protein [Haloferula sp. BvORR071]